MNNSKCTKEISLANYVAKQWLALSVIGFFYITSVSIVTGNGMSFSGLTSGLQQLMMFAFPVTFQFFYSINEYDLENNFIMVPIMLMQISGYLAALVYCSYIAYSSGRTKADRLTRAVFVMSAIYLMNYILCGYVERLI